MKGAMNGLSATARANGTNKLLNGNATDDAIYDGLDVSDGDNTYDEYYDNDEAMDEEDDDHDSHKLLPYEETAYDSIERNRSRWVHLGWMTDN